MTYGLWYITREDNKEVKLRLEAMNDVEDSVKQALEAAKG